MKLKFRTLEAYMHAVTFCVKHGFTFEGEQSEERFAPHPYTLTLTGGF